ncbi:phage recombination protein Bet [Arthrobacter sp. MYb211]|uniref:phage recombination protein Bet n=1 Tax=unclassified Arthrobacter TaxID=235627 RepID=UPI000CFB146C|nr:MULTISPECIES: phage recombination protein Bet [unclassified Arthrobacter]PRA13294.1 phage recombination protein Bet [Arthrobacter sp. MYb221]PRC10491.1 phage recombination protein Bet [Arthrobacter sp. MYb211]
MSAIAVQSQATALAIGTDQHEFNNAQVATLAQLGVVNADRANLAVFFHQSKRTGLDPFAKQIYMIARNSKEWDPERREKVNKVKYTIQTGIDGYRLIARRGADKAKVALSVDDTQWCGMDGVWQDVWLSPQPPLAAKVTVWRGNEHFSSVALWHEYVQTYYDKDSQQQVPNSMWKKMPASQLAKCAEALAYRKAFPLDLSGIYTDEEMPSIGDPAPVSDEAAEVTVQPRIRTTSQGPAAPVQAEAPAEVVDEAQEAPESPAQDEPVEEAQEPAVAPNEPVVEQQPEPPVDEPTSDPWTDGAPVPAAPAEPTQDALPEPAPVPPAPEPEPTASTDQQKQINAKLQTMGVKNKTQASTILSNYAGRQIDHSKELTVSEALGFLESTS